MKDDERGRDELIADIFYLNSRVKFLERRLSEKGGLKCEKK